MSIKLHDLFLKVRIPNKDFKIKSATDNDFVLLAVRHFSYRFIVTTQNLAWRLSEIFQQIILDPNRRSKEILYVFLLL
jgi:hypothetical protein